MSQVEVVYASQTQQKILTVMLQENMTVVDAILASQIFQFFPELINLDNIAGRVGIFGKKVDLETTLKAGDRIEIYRKLMQDPKEARRNRQKLTTSHLSKK